jgi:class 3 adenylate cyclase
MNETIQSIQNLINDLSKITDQSTIEEKLKTEIPKLSAFIDLDESNYYSTLNYHLYRNIFKAYSENEKNVCMWRFTKKLSKDQLSLDFKDNPNLQLLDSLTKVYFYSDPLDDLTCIFIPINESDLIQNYLNWIKNYFYDANYPTSLLWFYALDSSVASFFPDEIVFIGRRIEQNHDNILIPDFNHSDSILLKRHSSNLDDFTYLKGKFANLEFRNIFNNLSDEYDDRCLSHSGKKSENDTEDEYNKSWKKFTEVLQFGVSDRYEHGSISFSDLRNSTVFLNKYGKNVFRNNIQQPFFQRTQIVSKKFSGRIDKFMGDNIMCSFLQIDEGISHKSSEQETVINNFKAVFELNKVLLDLLKESDLLNSELGLRSGVSYGREILRSNLGNEIVRDFTVTGETVNFAARLEHFSINDLKLNNMEFFKTAINRYPQISEVSSVLKSLKNFNPETRKIIQDYVLYQNITSNLEKLEDTRFDIRFNQDYYSMLKEYILKKGYKLTNPETCNLYGFDEYDISGFRFRFYFSYFHAKGFNAFEKVYILPISIDLLQSIDIDKVL